MTASEQISKAYNAEPPLMCAVRQSFPRPKVEDIEGTVNTELSRIFPKGSIQPGARIGVTAGSRGITNIARVIKAAVDFLKSQEAKPFIIPAMGSHGGATPEGQVKLLANYEITEETMGVPILAELETRSLGVTPEGVEAFIAETAMQSDGILLLNRVKPHTDYKGEIESGLTKICAIGLGKLNGAREFHGHLFRLGLGGSIRSATTRVLETGKVIGGLALIENAYHETGKIVGVNANNLFEEEKALLVEAKELMGSIPVKEIDVLLCDRMGKNISGTGLDTNIIGRSVYGYVDGKPWQDYMPAIWRIVVDDLSDESEGNATGMGLVEIVTEKFQKKINYAYSTINAMTGRAVQAARTPVVLANTRDALGAAIRVCPQREEGPRVVYTKDTLKLDEIYISEACLPLVAELDHVEVVSDPAPLNFDDNGYIVSPFG